MVHVRRVPAILFCVVLALSLAAAAGCGTSKPVIKSLAPREGFPGTGLKVSGTHFGKTRESSRLTVGGEKAGIVSWSDTSITATVPKGVAEGEQTVTVTTVGGTSNKMTYNVLGTFAGSTPMPAMIDYFKSKDIDLNGWSYSVVATSVADPNWKLDKAEKSGQPTYYFLFHNEAGGWTVIDVGTKLSSAQMKIDGAPGDLKNTDL